MKFYLACVAVFALMVIVLRSCGGEEYISVAQASFYHHGKGGEARRKRLHRHHKYYGWINAHRCLGCTANALSAAVPAPHAEQRDTAVTQATKDRVSIRNGFQVDIMEHGRTPQQIIDDLFLQIGWQ